MQVWNALHAARWKYRMQKSRQKSPSGHHCTTLSFYIFATKARIDYRKENWLDSNISRTWPTMWRSSAYQRLRSSCSRVWGTPANFNWFRVLAALLHGSLVVGISQICDVEQRAPPIFGRAAGCHHVGHWPTFLVFSGIGCALVVWGGEGKLWIDITSTDSNSLFDCRGRFSGSSYPTKTS